MSNYAKLIRTDMKISVYITMVWGIYFPLKMVLQGTLSVEFISAIMVLGTMGVEFLPTLSRNTTFRSSTYMVLMYDVMYLLIVVSSLVFLETEMMMRILLLSALPYMLLTRNAGNKFKVLIGVRYGSKSENILTRLAILDNRAMVASAAIVIVLAQMGITERQQMVAFVFALILQSVQGWIAYNKYYKGLKF